CTTAAVLGFFEARPIVAWAAMGAGALTKGPIDRAPPARRDPLHPCHRREDGGTRAVSAARRRRLRPDCAAVVHRRLDPRPRVPVLRVRARDAPADRHGQLPPHRPVLVLLPDRPPGRIPVDRPGTGARAGLADDLARTPHARGA